MGKLVTLENVALAATHIRDEGGRVSVRTIRAQLGGGSPNEITPLLREWERSCVLATNPDLTIDPAILQLIARQIRESEIRAAAAAKTREQEVLADSEVIAEAGRAAEKLASALQSKLDQSLSQIQQLTGQLEERTREFETVRAEAADLIATANSKAERERDTAESVRQELVRSQIRVEAVPRLEAELSSLQTELRRVQGALADAKQAAAVAAAKENAETLRANECMSREKGAHENFQRLENDLSALRISERAALEQAQKIERELIQARAEIELLNSKAPVTP